MPSKNGVGPAVFNGVVESMMALMNGDQKMSATDRKAVYDHLAKHYEQFGMTPPDWEFVKLMLSVNDGVKFLDPTKNAEVYAQLKQLESLMKAEPKPDVPDVSALLTQQKLAFELQVRERQLYMA